MAPAAFSRRDGLLYGGLGLPLAFVALPLYVILPNHYAREFGVPIATLGALLLVVRLFDAITDPVLGRVGDWLFARSVGSVLMAGAVAALVLTGGFAGLFSPPVRSSPALLWWAGVCLVVTYTAYSLLSITHQAWGAMLGGDDVERGRMFAWREALSLAGVLLASAAPVLIGLEATALLLALTLAAGWFGWSQSRRPMVRGREHGNASRLWRPLALPAFRRLLGVFVANGIASAIPATLVLFFVQDRLQAGPELEPLFLSGYFLSAALSMPLWMGVGRHLGLARTWLAGMALAVASFALAATLGAGDAMPFLVICVFSGAALGTDLALPGAMLAGVIHANGERGQAEASYFGWWNFATKLNLALAAGLALPLLAAAGYTLGARDPAALTALALAYCALPCLLKTLAGAALYALFVRPGGAPIELRSYR